jgi:hypothetical protein
MHLSSGAESVHPVVLLTPREPLASEPSIGSGDAAVDAVGRHVLKSFNALAWAAIAVLFSHAVLVSFKPTACWIGCESASVRASQPPPEPPSPGAQAFSAVSPKGSIAGEGANATGEQK